MQFKVGGSRLEKLWELQSLDIKIDDIRKQIEKNQKIIEDAKSELIKNEKALHTKKEEFNKKRLKLRDLENDIKDLEEKIKKFVAQLYTLKTNQEYSALDTQIKNLKADKNIKEDELLNYAIELDKINEELNYNNQEIKKRRDLVVEQEKQIKVAIEQFNKEISTLEQEKSALRSQIDHNLLSIYDRIIKKKTNKKVLAYVKPLESEKSSKQTEESSNVWACSECNVTITVQELNMILLNKEIVICRSCSCILDIKLPDTSDNTT